MRAASCGKKEEAEKTYKKAMDADGIPDRYKSGIAAQMEAVKQNNPDAVKQE